MNNSASTRKKPNADSVITQINRQFRKLWRRVREATHKSITPIDEANWRLATEPYGFVSRLSAEENRRLRFIASDFLSRKNIVGANEFIVTDFMRIQIAAQACILILELGIESYDGWHDIVIYPAPFRPRREFTDAAGVVHTTQDVLAGEAWLGGPVVLSYNNVAETGAQKNTLGHNVVIHEFAHKLDMRNGNANGFPPLHRGMKKSVWRETFMAAYLDFCERADIADAQSHLDGGVTLDALPLDPYAAKNPAEFFAVLSESFFETPGTVAKAYPKVYAQLAAFYKQNPF